MEEHDVPTLEDMRGMSSLQQTSEPAAFERANYIAALQSWTKSDA
jgi:hypothetical protein